MNPWITVLKAADTAAFWHTHQRRKGEYEEPYINHLIEVAMLVAEATEGQRPDLVMAALLHDSIEDQEVPRCMIAESFGDAVATLVEELADDRSLPKAERKQRQVDTAHRKSEGARSSNSRTRSATCGPSPPARRRSGQFSGDWTTSNGHDRSLTASRAQIHGLKNNSPRRHIAPNFRSGRRDSGHDKAAERFARPRSLQ
jgi:hypothetical protein